MPEKPIAESPERWTTGRSGCTTQAAMAWPRPTPIVPYVPALRHEARQLGQADIHRARTPADMTKSAQGLIPHHDLEYQRKILKLFPRLCFVYVSRQTATSLPTSSAC